jgi:anti-sigma regulatory factor (Ser/Thr protein kinase)
VTRYWTSPDQERESLWHEALLYRGQSQLDRALRDFVAGGADAGEPVLAVLPTDNIDLVLGGLGDLMREVCFEDMAVVGHNPNCLLELYQEWIEGHEGRVRVVGESIWPGRTYAEMVECLRHEALVNRELGACPATILCPFDADRLEPAALAGAELTHPSLLSGDGVRRPSRRYREPEEVYSGRQWPQEPAKPPISEINFDGDLRELRESVAVDPIVARLSSERRADLVFAINEVATNTLKYDEGDCTARIWHDGTSVVTEVNSEWIVPDPAAGRRRPPPDSHRGRGLWLVNQLSDLVELRSSGGGTSLRIHVRDGFGADGAG